jgi:hypothetical protein
MLAGLGALAAFAVAERQGAALQDRFAAQRDNQATMTRFREAAAGVTDVEALLKDRRTLGVVLEAFQLESEIDKRGIIRKILTEPPEERASLANRLTDRRWRELARAFATSQASALTTTQVAALGTTTVQGLSLAVVTGLTAEQVAALRTTQIAALGAAQVGAIGTASLAGLATDEVAALSTTQVAGLTAQQLGALSSGQARALETTDLAALSSTQLRGLGTRQLAAFSTRQVAALGTAQLARLTRTQAAALDTAQLAALSLAQRRALASDPAPPLPEVAPARAPFADRVLLDRLVADATTNRFEKSMGESNGGLREALYFRRMAKSVTRVEELMSDKALTTVVRGALGLPESFAALDFDKQRDMLRRRLDLTRLQDPREVDKMARRYLALAAPQAATGNAITGLFDGGSSGSSGLASLIGKTVSLRA